MAKKDIRVLKEFLEILLTCEANKSGTITIPKSTANDIIDYINVTENFRKDKS
jgi:hypothetical protein